MGRLAGLAARRAWLVIACAIVLAVAGGIYSSSLTDRLDPYGFEDPSEERVRAIDRLEEATGVDPEPQVVAIVDGGPVDSAPMRARVERVRRTLAADPAIARVSGYADSGDPQFVSRDGRATYLLAFTRDVSEGKQQAAAERLSDRLEGQPGVTLGGEATGNAEVEATIEADATRAELLAFPIVFLLSLWFFRSAVAALLPPLVGALCVVATLAALRLLTEGLTLSIFALNLVTALGLGLAIDYTLLIVSRYREELAAHGPGAVALRRTLETAGRTVLFSALTVSAALASLTVFPQRFLYSMGLGGLLVPLLAGGIAVVVLPALLALLGPRVNALAPRALRRLAEREAHPLRDGGWYRVARAAMRRPVSVALASAALLLAIGAPFLGVKFAQLDARVLPPDTGARQTFEKLAERFDEDLTAPLLIVAESRSAEPIRELARELRGLDGLAGVTPPERVGGDVWLISAHTRADPVSEAGQEVVREIRDRRGAAHFLVGGEAAAQLDQKHSLATHAPVAVAILAVSTFVVLFLMTGSVVLPVKQVLMNGLVVAAAFGLLVFVFQEGRFEGLLGYESQGALELSQPLLLFALVFALSTDYGVFLFDRIKEAYDAGAGNEESVAIGIERTGRIVTAAAILFAVAIGALATSEISYVKQLGIGVAAAVLIDALVVRAALVPSLMKLLGRRNWWAPRPLARLHARVPIAADRADPGHAR